MCHELGVCSVALNTLLISRKIEKYLPRMMQWEKRWVGGRGREGEQGYESIVSDEARAGHATPIVMASIHVRFRARMGNVSVLSA